MIGQEKEYKGRMGMGIVVIGLALGKIGYYLKIL